MSTKSTIYFTNNFHLYKEVFDEENVYLTIENFEDLSINIYSTKKNGDLPRSVTIKLDQNVFKEIIKQYSKERK